MVISEPERQARIYAKSSLGARARTYNGSRGFLMKRYQVIAALVFTLVLLVAPRTVQACPA